MKNRIIELAKSNGADIVKFAPADRFNKNNPIFKILPETKTVIGLAFRVLRGAYRGVEEGSTYYQYTTMGVETVEETIMPMALMNICVLLEEEGNLAMPQKRHQLIMAEENSTNPEMVYKDIYRNKASETQIDFLDTAVKCGLGEKGFHNALLTDEFGPMVRYCFVLTDAEIEADDIVEPHLCDKCGKCKDACHGNAIDENGNVDTWQCAAYYSGANGTKNPFMPLDAFSDFDNRIDIIAGEANVTPETAKRISDNTINFCPSKHSYVCSICARACDVACYVHLEEKGVLTRKFKTPYRKRKEWKFDLSDFK